MYILVQINKIYRNTNIEYFNSLRPIAQPRVKKTGLLQQLNFKKILQFARNWGIYCLLSNDNYKYSSIFLRK